MSYQSQLEVLVGPMAKITILNSQRSSSSVEISSVLVGLQACRLVRGVDDSPYRITFRRRVGPIYIVNAYVSQRIRVRSPGSIHTYIT